MRIEQMILADLPSVAKLAAQLGYPVSEGEIKERFSEIQDRPKYALFVAKSKTNEVLGWIQINAEPVSLLIGPRADIAALVVDEKCRSQGVGKALVQRAEQWANENQLSLIRVRSNLKRQDAHRFYQREGYVLAKTANMFTKALSE